MPYHYDKDLVAGELPVYIRDDFSTKLLKHDFELMLKICQLKLIYEKKIIKKKLIVVNR